MRTRLGGRAEGRSCGRDTDFVPDGHLYRDPLHPSDGLIGPDDGGAAISNDDGQTWQRYPLSLVPNEGMRTVAVYRKGWIYSTSACGCAGYEAGEQPRRATAGSEPVVHPAVRRDTRLPSADQGSGHASGGLVTVR